MSEGHTERGEAALKILRPEPAAVLGSEGFIAEIQTTANLQDPHILPLLDSGEAEGYLYYVMPFIDGETLREKLDREKQLGVEEAVRIARDVADALDYAHRSDVIHRDIKPGNMKVELRSSRSANVDIGFVSTRRGPVVRSCGRYTSTERRIEGVSGSETSSWPSSRPTRCCKRCSSTRRPSKRKP